MGGVETPAGVKMGGLARDLVLHHSLSIYNIESRGVKLNKSGLRLIITQGEKPVTV